MSAQAASKPARRSPYREKCVIVRNDLGFKKYAEKYEYGMLWASEGTLSAVKRIFGETVRATAVDNMFREATMKFMFYNVLINCR